MRGEQIPEDEENWIDPEDEDITQEDIERMKVIFKQVDTDQNGVLDIDEACRAPPPDRSSNSEDLACVNGPRLSAGIGAESVPNERR